MDCRDLKQISERLNVTSYRMEDNIKDCQRRYERRKRKRKGVRYSIAIILILIICVVPVSVWEKTNILVYAKGVDKNIELKKNEKVILKKEMTPMGTGYVLYLRLPDSSYTYTLTNENGENLQNIFHKENRIYWLPDGTGSNLRYENGDIIKLPSVEKSLIQINVRSDDTKIITFELCLQKETDDECSVTLTKISR